MARSSLDPAPAGPPVLLTGDPALAEDVQRLALAAGAEIVVAADPQTRAAQGALVLVGADLAAALARRRHRPTGTAGSLLVVGWSAQALPAQSPPGPDVVGPGALWRDAVALGAEQVALLPDAQDWLVHRLARTVEPGGRARVVGVIGGCGGAGASLLAVALAATAAERGASVLLADLDPLGGGLDLTAGLDDVVGLRWPDLTSSRGRLPATSLHESLPRAGSLAVLSWSRGEPLDLPARAVESVLDAGCRGHDLVVVDLPRTLDAAADVAVSRLDELLVVVPSRVRAVVAAAQVVTQLAGRVPVMRAVVRRGAGERWSPRRVAEVIGVPLAAELREEPRLDDDLDRGHLPGARARGGLARAVEQCLGSLAAQRAA